jgi:putative nucleotidyltransferase with HDIG domain
MVFLAVSRDTRLHGSQQTPRSEDVTMNLVTTVATQPAESTETATAPQAVTATALPAVTARPPPPALAPPRPGTARIGSRVQAASTLVEALIAPLGDRWRHTCMVARRAAGLAGHLPKADRDLTVAAAWLHDVGYAPTLRDTGMHAIDGARFLRALGLEERLCALVALHSGAVYEADERGFAAALSSFAEEHSPVADALAAADFITGPCGQPMTVDERIAEILVRYEPGDPVYRAVTRSQGSLRQQVRRALRRARRAA